jgi:hypothetical protein
MIVEREHLQALAEEGFDLAAIPFLFEGASARRLSLGQMNRQ